MGKEPQQIVNQWMARKKVDLYSQFHEGFLPPNVAKAYLAAHHPQPHAIPSEGLSELQRYNYRRAYAIVFPKAARKLVEPVPPPEIKYLPQSSVSKGTPSKADLASLSKEEKGQKSEAYANQFFKQKGYVALTSKVGSNNGVDGIFIKLNYDGKITSVVFVESKFNPQGQPKLDVTKYKGRQMTHQWLTATLKQMEVSKNAFVRETARIIRVNGNSCLSNRYVNVMTSDGEVKWFKFLKKQFDQRDLAQNYGDAEEGDLCEIKEYDVRPHEGWLEGRRQNPWKHRTAIKLLTTSSNKSPVPMPMGPAGAGGSAKRSAEKQGGSGGVSSALPSVDAKKDSGKASRNQPGTGVGRSTSKQSEKPSNVAVSKRVSQQPAATSKTTSAVSAKSAASSTQKVTNKPPQTYQRQAVKPGAATASKAASAGLASTTSTPAQKVSSKPSQTYQRQTERSGSAATSNAVVKKPPQVNRPSAKQAQQSVPKVVAPAAKQAVKQQTQNKQQVMQRQQTYLPQAQQQRQRQQAPQQVMQKQRTYLPQAQQQQRQQQNQRQQQQIRQQVLQRQWAQRQQQIKQQQEAARRRAAEEARRRAAAEASRRAAAEASRRAAAEASRRAAEQKAMRAAEEKRVADAKAASQQKAQQAATQRAAAQRGAYLVNYRRK